MSRNTKPIPPLCVRPSGDKPYWSVYDAGGWFVCQTISEAAALEIVDAVNSREKLLYVLQCVQRCGLTKECGSCAHLVEKALSEGGAV